MLESEIIDILYETLEDIKAINKNSKIDNMIEECFDKIDNDLQNIR